MVLWPPYRHRHTHRMQRNMYAHTCTICENMHACTQVHRDMSTTEIRTCILTRTTYKGACMHIHICTPHVWEHTCTHICTCAVLCMHKYAHTCTACREACVCVHTYILYAQEHTHTYTMCTTCAATYMYAHVLKHPLVRREKLLGQNAN